MPAREHPNPGPPTGLPPEPLEVVTWPSLRIELPARAATCAVRMMRLSPGTRTNAPTAASWKARTTPGLSCGHYADREVVAQANAADLDEDAA